MRKVLTIVALIFLSYTVANAQQQLKLLLSGPVGFDHEEKYTVIIRKLSQNQEIAVDTLLKNKPLIYDFITSISESFTYNYAKKNQLLIEVMINDFTVSKVHFDKIKNRSQIHMTFYKVYSPLSGKQEYASTVALKQFKRSPFVRIW